MVPLFCSVLGAVVDFFVNYCIESVVALIVLHKQQPEFSSPMSSVYVLMKFTFS